MKILDENVPESQRLLLERRRIAVSQIGVDIGRKGLDDEDIIPLLRRLNRPTFFTLDVDFWDRSLRHESYCLVYLDISRTLSAVYIRRLLRHPELKTKAKRMGAVIRVEPTGLTVWRVGQNHEERLLWPK
jgi:hypothetical protein